MTHPDWPRHDKYLALYERHGRALREALYDVCERDLTHDDVGEATAKVWIIARSFATGVERHSKHGLDDVAAKVRAQRKWLDPAIARLRRRSSVPSFDVLPEIASVHGRLTQALTTVTHGKASPRSFVSKYLHFHAPVVPIYDSVAQKNLASWYRLGPKLMASHPRPAGAEENYWRFCVRIGLVVDEWRSAGIKPATALMIDNYAYRFREE